MLLPNIGALIDETQTCYADTLDLVDTCVRIHMTKYAGRENLPALSDQVLDQRRRLDDTPRHALVRTMTLMTGFLAGAAIDMAEVGGTTPADILAEWRRQAAVSIDLAEALLAGRTP